MKQLATRSYLYSSDLAEWLSKLLLEGHGIYNVGSDLAVTTWQLAGIVRDVLCPRAEVVGESDRLPRGTTYVPSIEKAHSLGLWEGVQLEDAIEKSAHHFST